MARATGGKAPFFKVRRSKLHGLGVFATRAIKKGTRVVEYLGDRISHKEADRRYDGKEENDNHTFLFSVDRGLVIDAGVDGNDARYINHSCDPNCESVIENRRVFVDAIRDIKPGEELTYDYQIGRERGDPPNVDEIYACRCGAKSCRGTMLWPPRKKTVARKPVKRAARVAAKSGAPNQKKSAAAKKKTKKTKKGTKAKR